MAFSSKSHKTNLQSSHKNLFQSQALHLSYPCPFLSLGWSPCHSPNPRPLILSLLTALTFQEQNSSSWNEDNSVQSINQSLIISFKHPEEFICRFKAPKLRERIFHFSAESIAKLKAKANKESSSNEISSFKSLSSLAWRCITRARSLPPDRNTSCKLAMNNRTKMEPPLPVEYVGNSIHSVSADSTAGELLEHDLGWAVWKLHLAIVSHTNRVLLEYLNEWLKSPAVYQHAQFFKTDNVMIGCSPRFNMYGNEFGMGKAVVVLSGYVNKFHGKVASYL